MKGAKTSPLYSRNCKLCGRPLGFVKTAKGQTIPLDLLSPVYVIIEINGRKEAVQRDDAFVTHFSTCKDANQFSKKGVKNEQQANEKMDAKTNPES